MANNPKTKPKQTTALGMRLYPLSKLFIQKLKICKIWDKSNKQSVP